MIAPFDLFGEEKYQYTFQMKCLESENHERVQQLKDSEEIGVRYMQEWEERAYERMEAKKEGKSEGENQFAVLTKSMIRDGRTEELLRVSEEPEYRRKLYREYGLEEEE